MIEVRPDYYGQFYCKAGQCRHSCCVGWEIEIDEEALNRYASVRGEFGQRLKASIDAQNGCFLLDEDERCPFLNREGLCDIILRMGEDALCQICTDHPRFRNFFFGRTETGLGLCCEEAARMIVTKDAPMRLLSDANAETADEEEEEFFTIREKLFSLLWEKDDSFEKRTEAILRFCGGSKPKTDPETAYRVLTELEYMSDEWTKLLALLKAYPGEKETLSSFDREFTNLLEYFLFRHTAEALSDGLLSERVSLCVLLTDFLRQLCAAILRRDGRLTVEQITETARLFSCEVEYSDCNIDYLLRFVSI